MHQMRVLDLYFYTDDSPEAGQASHSCPGASLQAFKELPSVGSSEYTNALLKDAFVKSLGAQEIDGTGGSKFKLPNEYPPIWKMLRDSNDGELQMHYGMLWASSLRSDIVDGHLFFREKNPRHDHVACTIRDQILHELRRLRDAEREKSSDTVAFITSRLPAKIGIYPGDPAIVIDVAVGESGQGELDKKINAYFAKNERNINILIVVEVNEYVGFVYKPSLITIAIPYSVRDHVRIQDRVDLKRLTEKTLEIHLGQFIANFQGTKEGFRRWPNMKRDLIVKLPYKMVLDACRYSLSSCARAPRA
ncbi:uncharacterized protein PAC_10350 [Phialocephala subalpina]|uniref:Uncharacterized protein n=1 Tax=Phialocephala subalpina TaxID=576137 RepID=A0A1L7X637_9HELO|nr:uncharacterized protein PAC_10350 [Phialocephala subalpina]